MSVTADPLALRGPEAAAKLALLRGALARHDAGAIRLRGEDWFAWATAGGALQACDGAANGAAGLLVTSEEACVLTDEVEADRLRQEEVPPGFTFHIAPWTEHELHDTYVLGAAGGRAVLSDRPAPGEQPLPASLKLRRMVLGAEEQERYRQLAREAAEAIGEALRAARPDWTEYQLAGEGARALLRRGLQPVQMLAAGERRSAQWRRPTPSHEALGARATLSCCARRHGLVARLSRSASFGAAPADRTSCCGWKRPAWTRCVPGSRWRRCTTPSTPPTATPTAGCDPRAAPGRHHRLPGLRTRRQPQHRDRAGDRHGVRLQSGLRRHRHRRHLPARPAGLENLTLDRQWPAADIGGRCGRSGWS
jgi:hypothetical protein